MNNYKKSSLILVLIIFPMLSFATLTTGKQEQINNKQLSSNAKILFDWAEKKYPHFFNPPVAGIESLAPWLYRYYPDTNNYVGVNTNNEVWVLGDVFGGLVYVSTVQELS